MGTPVLGRTLLLSLLSLMTCVVPPGRKRIPFSLNASLGRAYARVAGDKLVVGTGVVERTWRWTGAGLATVGLKGPGPVPSALRDSPFPADWSFPGLLGEPGEAKLLSLQARKSDDQGFT